MDEGYAISKAPILRSALGSKKKDCDSGNERFFVGQWSAKSLAFATDSKAGFCTPYCNFDMGLLE
jgi:hypothetical protein